MQSNCAFIADAHIATDERERAGAFADFVRTSAGKFEILVLVGDIFDLWLGPSFLGFPAYRDVFTAFHERAAQAKRTIFVPGNRDFLFDASTARYVGLELAQDAAVIQMGGRKVLATHGDLLCGRDWRYQIYRRLVRTDALKRFAKWLPRSLAFGMGALMQAGSRIEKKLKEISSMDVDAATAARFLAGRDPRLPGSARRLAPPGGFDAIVCGHVHTGRIIEDSRNGRMRSLVTLPPWTPEKPGIAWNGETFTEIVNPER
jgi:UDP-2,3-diacylglucosamine hydrolase